VVLARALYRFAWVQTGKLASPIFFGTFWSEPSQVGCLYSKKWALPSRFYEFHSCALCRKVSGRQPFAKILSPSLVLKCHSLSLYSILMTINEDRNEDRFKNWKLGCGWKLLFCDHETIKLTLYCVCFTNQCNNLFLLTSVIPEYHSEVHELLDLLQCIITYFSIHDLKRHTVQYQPF